MTFTCVTASLNRGAGICTRPAMQRTTANYTDFLHCLPRYFGPWPIMLTDLFVSQVEIRAICALGISKGDVMALPNSVRYIKNGNGGCWWKTALRKKQLHAGWDPVSEELLHAHDWPRIRPLCANTQDFNALKTLVAQPSQHVWITFESGFSLVVPCR
jgi:hypothetical protein